VRETGQGDSEKRTSSCCSSIGQRERQVEPDRMKVLSYFTLLPPGLLSLRPDGAAPSTALAASGSRSASNTAVSILFFMDGCSSAQWPQCLRLRSREFLLARYIGPTCSSIEGSRIPGQQSLLKAARAGSSEVGGRVEFRQGS